MRSSLTPGHFQLCYAPTDSAQMTDKPNDSLIAWLPDLIYVDGKFESDRALVCDASGKIAQLVSVADLRDEKCVTLSNRALLPGMVNAHSHAFQRVLRGRTEYRTTSSFSGGLPPAVSGSSPT